MAQGRVLIVHGSQGMRSSMTELLAREGLRVETLDSTYRCMGRFVDEPADLVILGLAGLEEAELELVPALKAEERSPRILLTFPGPRRDLAVRALEKGADGYLLEPFYPGELLHVVRGQLEPRAAAEPAARLPDLAREVAHAINNPLQILTLLLQKEKITKKELTDAIPGPLERIATVVGLLREFGSVPQARVEEGDAAAVAREAAGAVGARVEGPDSAPARIDPANYAAAVRSIVAALRARAPERGAPALSLAVEADAVALRAPLPAPLPDEAKPEDLLDAVFVVDPERAVLPGLALPRLLLEGQGGSLTLEEGAVVARVRAPAPRARASRAPAPD
jgi:DNA-binding response OmpR family regulator